MRASEMTITDRTTLTHITRTASELLTAPSPRRTADAYLRHRSIDVSALPSSWKIGYAPPGWTRLTDELRRQGFDSDALLAAGISRRSSRDQLIDAFRDRLVLPVHDGDNVAGFIGRDLSGNPNAPKYLNTASTLLYHKGELLYGLSEGSAQPNSEAAQPILCEGPLDVLAIAARAARLEDGTLIPVAACGTAVTPSQAGIVADYAARASNPVVVAFDGDTAGRDAAAKAGEYMRLAGADVRVAMLPAGVDPADHLADAANDLEPFRAANATPLLTLQIERIIAYEGDRLRWAEGQVSAARRIAAYLVTYTAEQAVSQAGPAAAAVGVPATTFAMILGVVFQQANAIPPPGTQAGDLLRAGAAYAQSDAAAPRLERLLTTQVPLSSPTIGA